MYPESIPPEVGTRVRLVRSGGAWPCVWVDRVGVIDSHFEAVKDRPQADRHGNVLDVPWGRMAWVLFTPEQVRVPVWSWQLEVVDGGRAAV